jgi:RNA polymerase sigma-70 factor, ECF subfamily
VATNPTAVSVGPQGTRKSREFLKDFTNSQMSAFRGTAIAIGAIRMENRIDAAVRPTREATEPSDWLSDHGDYLFNLAVGQVRDPLVAEDLVQETFLAGLKARERFSGRSSDRTWLVGILRHKIYDHLRRVCRERPMRTEPTVASSNQEAWNNSVLWAHEVAAECMEPSRRMELAEFRHALEAALGKLPTRIAQVFQLYEVEERPNREVCARLDISENNLWVMLHRARKQLQQELGDWWHGAQRRHSSAEVKTADSGAPTGQHTQSSISLN